MNKFGIEFLRGLCSLFWEFIMIELMDVILFEDRNSSTILIETVNTF